MYDFNEFFRIDIFETFSTWFPELIFYSIGPNGPFAFACTIDGCMQTFISTTINPYLTVTFTTLASLQQIQISSSSKAW
jgi:hypothetical protein